MNESAALVTQLHAEAKQRIREDADLVGRQAALVLEEALKALSQHNEKGNTRATQDQDASEA